MTTFAGTASADFIIPTANGVDYRGGAGNDTYILSSLIAANAVINIIDTEGANKIQLADGLTIAFSAFTANAVQLVLSNGAVIVIQGAAAFTFEIGANATSGDAAVVPNATYAQFAAALGTTVPTGTATTSGTPNFVVPTSGSTPPPPVGGFTLTANVDTINGGAGNDTIIAGEGSLGGAHTLGSSDVINGGGGIDTLDLILAGGAATGQVVTPRTSSVERFNIQAIGADNGGVTVGGDNGINMINATGYTELWSRNSTNDLSLFNVAEKAMIGVSGGTTASDYQVQVNAAARTGDLAIALDTATVGNLFVNSTGVAGGAGYASTTIDARAGVSTVGTLDVGAALATVTVTGDGSLKVTSNLAATVRTINAADNNGGVDLSITNSTGAVAFTGGAGKDRINFGGTLTLGDRVDGGGDRDILAVADQTTIVTGLQVSNVEILELATLSGTLEAARIAGLDEVRVTTNLANGWGTAIVNGLTSNSTFVTNDSGNVTLNLTNAQVAGTLDTLNLKTGIAGAGWVDVLAPGVETVAYTQNNKADAGANTTVNFFDNDGTVDMSTLTIASKAGNTVNFDNLVNTIDTVNAGAAAGDVHVSILMGNPTNGIAITGGSGADNLTGGSGRDIIIGGDGNDIISGDGYWFAPGTGGAAIPQVSTLTLTGAVEAGDTYSASVNGTTYTSGTTAGLTAAIAAGEPTLGVVNSGGGVITLTGPANGSYFPVFAAGATNVAAVAEVSTVTINAANLYDAGDVVTVTIDGTNYSTTAIAGETAILIAGALATQINGGAAMTASSGGTNVLTLTGVNAATNYVVSAGIVDTGAGTQTAQVSTITLGGALDAGDTYSVNVGGNVYTAIGTAAALAAAIGTAGGALSVAATSGGNVVTLTGPLAGTAFTVAAGPTTNQAAASDTATFNFATTANWDAGDAYTVTVDGTAVAFAPLGGDTTAVGAAAAFSTAFYASVLPAGGYTLANNGAGVVTISGVAGANVVLSAEAVTSAVAVAQIDTVTFTEALTANWGDNTTASALSVTVNGTTFIQTLTVATEAGGEAAATALVNQVNLAFPGVITAVAANGTSADGVAGLTLTANVAGTPFTASAAQAGDPLTVLVPAVVVTLANDTVSTNLGTYMLDNNTSLAAGTPNQTIGIGTTPGVTTTTVVNAAPVVVPGAPTAAGNNDQMIVAGTSINGQGSADQYFGWGAASDVLTGDAGNDLFMILSGSSLITIPSTIDTIIDLNLGGATGVLGVDKVALSIGTFGTPFAPTDLINAGTPLAMTGPTVTAAVQALFNAGGALNGSVHDVGLFTYGADTYLIATDWGVGYGAGDVIIKVTGVTGTLDLTDIVLM